MSTLNFRDPSKDKQTLLTGSGVKSANDLLLRPVFLMCAPTFYDPRENVRDYAENSFCSSSNDSDFSPDEAIKQHAELRAAILDLGGSIVLNPGKEGLFDQVFTADPSITFMTVTKEPDGKISAVGLKVLSSNFYHHARAPEIAEQMGDIIYFRNTLMEEYGISTSFAQLSPELHGEGTGDNVYDAYRDMFWCGYKGKQDDFLPANGRSDPDFYKFIDQSLSMDGNVQPLEVDNGFFHIDTSLAPLQNGHIICHKSGMTKDAFEKLTKVSGKDNLIIVSEEDALKYASNLILLGDNNIIMPKTSPKLLSEIEGRGYNVVQIDLSQFVNLSGGGAHCLTNRVNQIRTQQDLEM